MPKGKLRKRGKSISVVSRETVSKAIDDYLKQGGKITVLESQEEKLAQSAVVKNASLFNDDQLLSP